MKMILITDINQHCMDSNLYKYLEIKIHPYIDNYYHFKIIVRGKYERKNNIISNREKTDKLCNWKRPTVEILMNEKILYVNCFPGQNYIEHYTNVIKNYIYLKYKSISMIYMIVSDSNNIFKTLYKTNINKIPLCDILIIGAVEKLTNITQYANWQGDGDFHWSINYLNKKKICLLSCDFSFWGDISSYLFSIFAEIGFKIIIYTGKVGGLKSNMKPNFHLATGSTSLLNNKLIQWKNIIQVPSFISTVLYGKHYTIPSVLYETKEWFTENKNEYSFVDPEIGWMAFMANECDIKFGYIHIISDILSDPKNDNLSNEREKLIFDKRQKCYQNIVDIIKYTINNL